MESEVLRDEHLPSRLGLPQILLSLISYTIQAIMLSMNNAFTEEKRM